MSRKKISEEQKKANKAGYNLEYAREKFKRVPFDVQLEEYDKIKAAANVEGLAVNTFIKRCIAEHLKKRHKVIIDKWLK